MIVNYSELNYLFIEQETKDKQKLNELLIN